MRTTPTRARVRPTYIKLQYIKLYQATVHQVDIIRTICRYASAEDTACGTSPLPLLPLLRNMFDSCSALWHGSGSHPPHPLRSPGRGVQGSHGPLCPLVPLVGIGTAWISVWFIAWFRAREPQFWRGLLIAYPGRAGAAARWHPKDCH